MLHAACTRGNRVDFWLLMVDYQIVSLTPGLSFGHNLCFKCPNGRCEPILNIYTSITFQGYKQLFKLMGLAPAIMVGRFESPFGTPTPTMGVHLGVWGFIPSHFLHSRERVMWLPGLFLGSQPCNPFFGHEPKAKVAIGTLDIGSFNVVEMLWCHYNH